MKSKQLDTKYFMVTPFNEIIGTNFEVKTGLNTSSDENTIQLFQFCSAEYVFHILFERNAYYEAPKYWVREVTIPDGVKLKRCMGAEVYRVDSIILGERKPLNDIATIKYLIVQGAKLNGDILLYAASICSVDIFNYVLDMGINVDINGYRNIVSQASRYGRLDMIKYLVDEKGLDLKEFESDILPPAAINNRLDIIQYMDEQGVNIHENREEVLRIASGEGHLKMVRFVIDRGADIQILHSDALRDAIFKNHLEVVKFLVSKGGNLKKAIEILKHSRMVRFSKDAIDYFKEQGININSLK